MFGLYFILLVATFHPHHVSNTEIFFNPTSAKLEISISVIPEDLENALKKSECMKIDLLNQSQNEETNKCVEEYFNKNFSVSANNKNVKLSFLGFEFKEKEFHIYFESEKIENTKNLIITNQILYDEAEIQVNIIRYKNKKRDISIRLKNPDKIWKVK